MVMLGNLIISKRGLRQGDHLSPLLFVLVVYTFTKVLRLADENGIISGLAPSNFKGRLLLDLYLPSFEYSEYSDVIKDHNESQLELG